MMAKAYEDFGFETENSIGIVVDKVENLAQIDENLGSRNERLTHFTCV